MPIRIYFRKRELLGLLLSNTSFDNRKFPNLSDAVKYFKEDAKGVIEVCDIVEEYAKERVLETVKGLIAAGASVSNEQIKKATNLTDDEIEKLRSQLS